MKMLFGPSGPTIHNFCPFILNGQPPFVPGGADRVIVLGCPLCMRTLTKPAAPSIVASEDTAGLAVARSILMATPFVVLGPLHFVDDFVAVNREHVDTKTLTQRHRHYREAMGVVRKYHGSVPLKWWLAQPYSVWFRSIAGYLQQNRRQGG